MTTTVETRRRRIERAIDQQFSGYAADLAAPSLVDLPPDRVRGQVFLITVEGFRSADGPSIDPMPVAVALELSTLHALTHRLLVADRRLPAGLDRDRIVLAGDLFQAKAFEAVGQLSAPPTVVQRCYAVLAEACIGSHEAIAVRDDEVPARQSAVLVAAAARLGGIVRGVAEPVRAELEDRGATLGRRLAGRDPGSPSVPTNGSGPADSRQMASDAIEALTEAFPEGGRRRAKRKLRALAGRAGED